MKNTSEITEYLTRLEQSDERDPDVIALLVASFRRDSKAPPDTHAWAAMLAAVAYWNSNVKSDLEVARNAEVWALRALVDGPRTDAMCLLGEIARSKGDLEGAIAWYEAAGAVSLQIPGPKLGLVAARRERLVELRREAAGMLRLVKHGQPVDPRQHALIVQTSPRKKPYLERTLESLKAAGSDWWEGPKFIVADGFLLSEVPDGWTFVPTVEVLGQAKTFFRALNIAASYQMLTFFEDDIELAKDSLAYMKRVVLDPDLALISWHDVPMCPFRSIPPPPVFTIMPAKSWSRAQGITLPRRTIHAILDSSITKSWPVRHGADRIFAAVMPEALCAVHYPNLVQHVGGLDSEVGNDDQGERLSLSYIGSDASALALLDS
jgi:hypothetical protein